MPINFTDEESLEKLSTFISSQFQLYKTTEETFLNILNNFNYPNVPKDTVDLWFQQVHDKNLQFDDEINTDYLKIIEIIEENFFVYKNAIFKNEKHDEWNFVRKNPRYGFKCNEMDDKLKGLYIIDFFHGKQKEIRLHCTPINANENYPQFETIPISISRLLVLEHCTVMNYLYLLTIDYSIETCKLLSYSEIKTTRFCNMKFIFDQENDDKLVIVSDINTDDENPSDQIIAIDLTKNSVDTQTVPYIIDENLFTNCYRLNNNKICGLVGLEEDEIYTSHVGYWEVDLNASVLELKTQVKFKLPSHVDFSDFWLSSNSYAWLKNICFMSVQCEDSNLNTIYSFNVDTQQCLHLNYKYSLIEKTSIDESDESLSILADGSLYRRRINRPETLKNIAWFNVRRQTLFHNKDFYSHITELMPFSIELELFYHTK